MSGIGEFLGKLWFFWGIAGLIVTFISYLYIYLTTGLVNLAVAFFTDRIIGMLIFPFSIIAYWSIDPLSVIYQAIITIVMLVLTMTEKSRR